MSSCEVSYKNVCSVKYIPHALVSQLHSSLLFKEEKNFQSTLLFALVQRVCVSVARARFHVDKTSILNFTSSQPYNHSICEMRTLSSDLLTVDKSTATVLLSVLWCLNFMWSLSERSLSGKLLTNETLNQYLQNEIKKLSIWRFLAGGRLVAVDGDFWFIL